MKYLDVKGKGGPDKPPKECKGNKCPPPPPPQPIDACVPGAGDNTSNDPLDELYGIVDVNAPASNTWTNSPVTVDIAILDTGADTDHTDLCVHNAVGFTNEGWEDNHGHGSHTSGTAGARDDNFADGGEVVGVAPTARIWSVKVCTAFGGCPGDAIVAGIDYVTANADQIKVANMSLGGGGSDQPHPQGDCSPITGDAEHLAICNSVNAGVTYVVSAGNSGADAAGFTPAAFDEVITVAASDIDEQPASFSNYGADVDLIAPGVNIKSTYLNNNYANFSGTSMSSPHVAGGAALYILANPGSTPFEVRDGLVADGRHGWAGQGGLHPEPMLDVSKY
ncbi:MAG: S8 family serine peptidase [Gemmatimonadota bacterium]|nr:MAG: S8 family serine peptidase [Gemmatimonadota bacterium]